MSENKYTPEPWELRDDYKGSVYLQEQCIARCCEPQSEENARRIVACVNACAGVDTECLEVAPIGIFASKYGSPGYIDQLEKQRDELLAACEGVIAWDKSRKFPIPYKVRDPIHAAIASVKGEQ